MTEPNGRDRFAPRATSTLARMFDGVTLRYALLNRIMTLGQDHAWRRAMWSAVPERARIVLDLCTGDGSSLPGLRRPGRLVIGLDASHGMLTRAAATMGSGGWAPRLVCADAFALPFRDQSIDAVTVAFGMRNLRPQSDAVAELSRVLRPGGTLAVLEATGPGKGLAAPFHRFWLRFMVPIFGRISPDPSAYRYLAESVLAFGPGDPFLTALPERGMVRSGTHRFLLGATHLWVSNKAMGEGVQDARGFEAGRGETPQEGPSTTEERVWSAVGTLTSLAVAGSLAWAGWILVNPASDLPLERSRRGPLGVAALGAAVIFLVRALRALRRAVRPAGRS